MPLEKKDVNPEERIEAGYAAAKADFDADKVVDTKDYGQTNEEIYPYTYWWKVGWNKFVAEKNN